MPGESMGVSNSRRDACKFMPYAMKRLSEVIPNDLPLEKIKVYYCDRPTTNSDSENEYYTNNKENCQFWDYIPVEGARESGSPFGLKAKDFERPESRPW